MTEVILRGEFVTQDAKAIDMLMHHIMTQVGIEIRRAEGQHELRPGEFFALRERDIHAQPGRVRMLLRTGEEVRKLHAIIHGQVIRVGDEQGLVEVLNDAVDFIRGQGNGIGARA